MTDIEKILETRADEILISGEYKIGGTCIFCSQENGYYNLSFRNTFDDNTVQLHVKRICEQELDSIIKNMPIINTPESINVARNIAENDNGKFQAIVFRNGFKMLYMDNFETGFHLTGQTDLVTIESDSLNVCATGLSQNLFNPELRDMRPYELKAAFKDLFLDQRAQFLIPSDTKDMLIKPMDGNGIYIENLVLPQYRQTTYVEDEESLRIALDLILKKLEVCENTGVIPSIETLRITPTEVKLAAISNGSDRFGNESIEQHDVYVEFKDDFHEITFSDEDETWTAKLKVKELTDEDIETIVTCLKADMKHGNFNSKTDAHGASEIGVGGKQRNINSYIEKLSKIAERDGSTFEYEIHTPSSEFLSEIKDYFYRKDYSTGVEIIGAAALDVHLDDGLWASPVLLEEINEFGLRNLTSESEARDLLIKLCAEDKVMLFVGNDYPYVKIFSNKEDKFVTVQQGYKQFRIAGYDDDPIDKEGVIKDLVCRYMTRAAAGEEIFQEAANLKNVKRTDYTNGNVDISTPSAEVSIGKNEHSPKDVEIFIAWGAPPIKLEAYSVKDSTPEEVANKIVKLESAQSEEKSHLFVLEATKLLEEIGQKENNLDVDKNR